MPLLEVQTVNKITATIALDESIAQKVDQYALFINAPSDEVVSKEPLNKWFFCALRVGLG